MSNYPISPFDRLRERLSIVGRARRGLKLIKMAMFSLIRLKKSNFDKRSSLPIDQLSNFSLRRSSGNGVRGFAPLALSPLGESLSKPKIKQAGYIQPGKPEKTIPMSSCLISPFDEAQGTMLSTPCGFKLTKSAMVSIPIRRLAFYCK